jgi:hypothetical protein
MLSTPITHDPDSALTENQAADFLGFFKPYRSRRPFGDDPLIVYPGR